MFIPIHFITTCFAFVFVLNITNKRGIRIYDMREYESSKGLKFNKDRRVKCLVGPCGLQKFHTWS
ncbi:hypothetical protein HanIR_Chr01g0036451 [Helianthus annuus]|nr:hypothetical protein HanIR_Chr01g0036451 [Helianthus annuus]